MWDDHDDLCKHWWRVIDFLALLGKNGIVLNILKFQFARKSVDFAGFNITENSVKPMQRYVDAVLKFPSPEKLTDVRSWFGLVNQVSHYNKFSTVMEPFKHLLSPKAKFQWTDELEQAFQKSQHDIVEAILRGVEIYDLQRYTCLRPDWSKTGIGFFLSQKHCDCSEITPSCCAHGWKITLAGSRFLRPAETRYAPVEGEALAIAWSLEQTRYFTQGCDKLIVVTDHKPLVKLFGDRTLDEIANPRLFRLKQRSLMWRFTVLHEPGRDNLFSDATSRRRIQSPDDWPSDTTDMEEDLIEVSSNKISEFRAITWDTVKDATASDHNLQKLAHMITQGFPATKPLTCSSTMEEFWRHRDNLHLIDKVIMMGDRIVIPKSLRPEVLQSLHAAHQGVTSMTERARCAVYWPGISKDIDSIRASCYQCNRIAPSQAKLPPVMPHIPTTPFEAVACDFFYFKGRYFFVAADRLSGWTEQTQLQQSSSSNSGAKGLCTALRKLFATFGVPAEISSDGGPEFTAAETKAFFKRWGVRHRVSSSYLPSSNGRAELAVKSTKRLLMDNIDSNENLDTDKMVRALLTKRNTPDPGCQLAPSEVLFGHKIRDSLPFIRKDISIFENPQISNRWKKAWESKEDALRSRYVKSLETLREHCRPLSPLKPSDQVLIQNQTGQHPTRWDRSGVVVSAGDYDQYHVKVAGTGRVTLRNRRFLKKYQPHSLHGVPTSSVGHAYNQPDVSSPEPSKLPPTSLPETDEPSVIPEDSPIQSDNPATNMVEETSLPKMTSDTNLRRSARNRMPRKFYEPETGRYIVS